VCSSTDGGLLPRKGRFFYRVFFEQCLIKNETLLSKKEKKERPTPPLRGGVKVNGRTEEKGEKSQTPWEKKRQGRLHRRVDRYHLGARTSGGGTKV